MKPPALDTTALLAAIVESSNDAIVSKSLSSIVTSWNSGAERLFGYTAEEMVGQSILKIIPAERHSEEEHLLGTVRKGERVHHFNTIRLRKDGRPLNVSLTVSPIRNSNGDIIGVSKIARDITDWKILQDTQALMLRELNHRSKNLVAVADAIVRQSARSTKPSELVSRVSRRLHALSVNQDLLIERNWHGAELSQIIRSQIAPLLDDQLAQISLNGPAIVVSPAAAQALAMAIFELAANALKFGALSTRDGRVAISWNIKDGAEAREFQMTWEESGGPSISAPRKKGFGSTIIENLVARSLLGHADVNFAKTGLVWRLIAPESALLTYSGTSTF